MFAQNKTVLQIVSFFAGYDNAANALRITPARFLPTNLTLSTGESCRVFLSAPETLPNKTTSVPHIHTHAHYTLP